MVNIVASCHCWIWWPTTDLPTVQTAKWRAAMANVDFRLRPPATASWAEGSTRVCPSQLFYHDHLLQMGRWIACQSDSLGHCSFMSFLRILPSKKSEFWSSETGNILWLCWVCKALTITVLEVWIPMEINTLAKWFRQLASNSLLDHQPISTSSRFFQPPEPIIQAQIFSNIKFQKPYGASTAVNVLVPPGMDLALSSEEPIVLKVQCKLPISMWTGTYPKSLQSNPRRCSLKWWYTPETSFKVMVVWQTSKTPVFSFKNAKNWYLAGWTQPVIGWYLYDHLTIVDSLGLWSPMIDHYS